jgi:hypothetical protein
MPGKREGGEMGKSSWLAVAAVLAASLVFGVAVASSHEPGELVTLKTTISISPYGYLGKVKSSNENCVEERRVVLKQKGHGLLGKTTTKDTGKWEIPPEELHYKGPLPYELYAEVKPITQGTAGTVYKCLGAKSRTIEIAGG